jgi:hypothetical protein
MAKSSPEYIIPSTRNSSRAVSFSMPYVPENSKFNFEVSQIPRSHGGSFSSPNMVTPISRNNSVSSPHGNLPYFGVPDNMTNSFNSYHMMISHSGAASLNGTQMFSPTTRDRSFQNPSHHQILEVTEDQRIQEIEAHEEQPFMINAYPMYAQNYHTNAYQTHEAFVHSSSLSYQADTIDEEAYEDNASQGSYESDHKENDKPSAYDLENLSADASYFKVDPDFQWENFVSDPERIAAIKKWKQKKADLLKHKPAKHNQYQVRVDVANRRPRVKGRFLPNNTV